jgi:hypothetical protein
VKSRARSIRAARAPDHADVPCRPRAPRQRRASRAEFASGSGVATLTAQFVTPSKAPPRRSHTRKTTPAGVGSRNTL